MVHTIDDKKVEHAIDQLVKALPEKKREKKKRKSSSTYLQQARPQP